MQIFAAVGALTIGVLWARSFWHADDLSWRHAFTKVAAATDQGGMELVWTTWPVRDDFGWELRSHDPIAWTLTDEYQREFYGFSWETEYRFRRTAGSKTVARKLLFRMEAPLLALVAVAITPWLLRRRRRLAAGKCPECSYILGPATQRCSECGCTIPGRASGDQP